MKNSYRKLFFSFLLIMLYSCNSNSNTIEPINEIPSLELLNKYGIDIEEPSGLDLGQNNKSLWTVSDRKSKMYKLDLEGKILQEISLPATDLEGITYDDFNNNVWVVLEGEGEVLQIDTLGNELKKSTIPAVRDGGGLEGITINPANNHLFLIKENDPSVLLELDTEFNTLKYNRISSALDYSGIDFDDDENILWIVSDQNKEVFKYDLNGKIIESFSISVNKAEGIAFDNINNLVYLVSDSADSLYVYKYNPDF